MERRNEDPRALLAALAHHEALAVLVDLDGTLIPFAATAAEAPFPDDTARMLRALHELRVQVVVVSGRPRDLVEPFRPRVPGAWWFAEHGAWRHGGDQWWGPRRLPTDELFDLVSRLAAIAATIPGARLECKTLSCALHWREVPAAERARLATVDLAVDEWLEAHAGYERLDGIELVEVRSREYHKGRAVAWVKERLPRARMIALGDDLTDEDMFRPLGTDDLAISVGRPAHTSHARAFVEGVGGAHDLLAWLLSARGHGATSPPPIEVLDHGGALDERADFVVVSNRTPDVAPESRQREVGGLVAALAPALVERSGVWLGWSGAEGGTDPTLTIDAVARPRRACFDFPPGWRQRFYGGFCNRALWPLLHGFPGRVRYHDDDWQAYVEANATYARLVSEVANPHATIWVHDYHLFLVGAALRQRGHRGPMGFFLHVPFPPVDLFETLPWARELLEDLLAFDVIGLQTRRYVDNLLAAMQCLLGVAAIGDVITRGDRSVRVQAFPIGIDPAPFHPERELRPATEVDGLRAALADRKLLLGVDRLDYSKGVPERLVAFEQLLHRHPKWRRRVSMVQISVPSRADVPEYAELRGVVENLVGRINGRFGDADWVPVRYLYRSYDHEVLAQLYRVADVGVITPLRDGMNLVAKEFVAAQDPARPAALVLSRFAGAAEALSDAVLTNPYHPDGLADDLDRALSMPLDERQRRHARMLAAVEATTSQTWVEHFLAALIRG